MTVKHDKRGRSGFKAERAGSGAMFSLNFFNAFLFFFFLPLKPTPFYVVIMHLLQHRMCMMCLMQCV
jgi:hypothetical protein